MMDALELEDHLEGDHCLDIEFLDGLRYQQLLDEHDRAHRDGQIIWMEHEHTDPEQPAGKYAAPGDEDF